MQKNKTSAIVLAGGSGSRMGTDKAKQFITIFGKTVIERTVLAFDKSELTDEIIVVVRECDTDAVTEILGSLELSKSVKVVSGGGCRAESAKNGFAAISPDSEFVAIHDAARCLITPEMIDKVVKTAHKSQAATAVSAVFDTVKQVDKNGKITATIPRETVFRAQTPQVFSKAIYNRALEACNDFTVITDDNMLVEFVKHPVRLVECGANNIKVTTVDDLTVASAVIEERIRISERLSSSEGEEA